MFPCAFSPWSPGIGDPNPIAWVVVGLYLITAYACVTVGIGKPLSMQMQRRERVFWIVCAVLLTFLAVNKQLDLQTLLTSLARCAAYEQGWYEDRRSVQRLFIAAVSVGGLAVVIGAVLVLRGTLARTGLAVLGLGLVTTFVVVRAASFHHMDTLIDSTVIGLRMTWLIELLGPTLILVAAIRARRDRRP